MKRREFLIHAIGVALAGAAATLLPGDLLSKGRPVSTLRGSAEGKLYQQDAGGAWQQCADFGPACTIRSVTQKGDTFYAWLEVQGHPFSLTSRDARTWYTADYRAPTGTPHL